MKKQTVSSSSKLSSYIKKADVYGEQVGFQIGGESSFNTMCGAIITLMVTILVIYYSSIKFLIVINKGNTSHIQFSNIDALDHSKIYNYSNTKFNNAIFFVPRDWNNISFENAPEIDKFVTVRAFMTDWYIDGTGFHETKTELSTQTCS